MRVFCSLWIALAILPAAGADESFTIYTDAPRLFLNKNRLRLLKRERERRSDRWTQFDALVSGRARMPEPAFADALYYRIAGDETAGRRAIAWALGGGRDLRQLALVLDWCQPLLDDAQTQTLAAKVRKSMEAGARDNSTGVVRGRVLAAVALAGLDAKFSSATLEGVVKGWWQGQVVPAIKNGRDPIARDDYFALFEILHALRDNLNTDLRDDAPHYFKDLPIHHLLAYYPAAWPASENEYRIQAGPPTAAPDLDRAALARAADLAMVSYDLNSPGGQVLQGWLMHDRFLLRGPFGAPYEFLWANPYQPGLSFYHVPLVFYDEHYGHLFARSSWDESADWLGTVQGGFQLFQKGKITALDARLPNGPVSVTEASVFSGMRFRALLKGDEAAFSLGLKPGVTYQVEVDEEELREETADPGGIIPLDLPQEKEVGVRLKALTSR